MKALLCLAVSLPLAAQWDARVEVPFLKAQGLPQTLLAGSSELISGTLDTGHGGIATLSHRLWTFGPVLRMEWSLEASQWRSDGSVLQGSSPQPSSLKQSGLGGGIGAQFWVPFTGIAGEITLLERFQNYRFQAMGQSSQKNLARTWLRAGGRWRLPFPGIHPYLTASYQQPITKKSPVALASTADFASYMEAQGTGQEFDRMWTFGVGVNF